MSSDIATHTPDASPAGEKPQVARSEETAVTEASNILVIDDDQDILEMLTLLLSRQGYAVDTAATGAEAIDKSKGGVFNLALIDVVLPDIQGTRLQAQLKETEPRMRKIIVTGYPTFGNAVEAVDLGADAYVIKPFDPVRLLEIVKEQLNTQRLDSAEHVAPDDEGRSFVIAIP
jgi:DNA-binding NtrC family response regulator